MKTQGCLVCLPKHNRAVRSFSCGVLMVMCCCVCTFTSLIWLFGDTSDFPRISRYTFQPISYLPNIHLKHGLISAFVCFVRFSFHFKKKNSRKPRNPLTHTHTHTHTHTLVWTNAQCPVSKGFTSAAAASALYRQSPANTIRLIWQAKENQTASQYTKEVRAAGALNREAIHSLWPSFTAQGGLDRGGGGGYLGEQQIYNRRGERNERRWRQRKRFQEAGMEQDRSFQVLFICAARVQEKHERESSVPTRPKLHFIGLCLDKIVVPSSWAMFNLQDIFCLSQMFRATTGSHQSFCLINKATGIFLSKWNVYFSLFYRWLIENKTEWDCN